MRHSKSSFFLTAAVAICFVVSGVGAGDVITTLEGELISLDSGPVTVAPTQPDYTAGTVTESQVSYYDRLPQTLAEMDQYERLAMEPYPNYDAMPLHQKAETYSRQFEYMRNRKPNFSPEIVMAIRESLTRQPSSEETPVRRTPDADSQYSYTPVAPRRPEYHPAGTPSAIGPGASIYDTMKYMYNPPPPKKPRQTEVDIETIPGPWGTGAKKPAPVQETVQPDYSIGPDGNIRFEKRMDSMRGGWNAKSIVEGRR